MRTTHLFRQSLAAACVAAALLFTVGCSGDKSPTAPYNPPPPPPPAPTLSSIKIVGDDVLVARTSKLYTAKAVYSDGSSKDVTSQVSWSVTSTSLALMQAGQIYGNLVGNGTVAVSFQGLNGSLSVVVIGTAKWADLPPISDAAKAWVQAYVLNSVGVLYRWKGDAPIKVWANAGFPAVNVQDAITFWTPRTGLRFTIVPDSMSAAIVFTFDATIVAPDGSAVCAIAGPYALEGYLITAGLSKHKPGCTDKLVIAHELGHMLGFGGHTPGGDVMSSPGTWAGSALLDEIARWVYSAPVGTIPY